ncbi:hypothetical protein HOP50_03g24350 [Chloropicon primus]|uniref:Uncharacterized protein n=1 Tax=Chloropicon primus TaxID=1764295 RepID=A0A5B8MGV5_9CHLO|nr:hypothetical protein A3770_03p24360 [Chloropicon primus]UPQ99129.1 hypothetical protein HOP50_03g24350 [Chloropicon primus]|eukprot:QDZ19918.1 hypothetical protein A3770_03p24360 [Chloropicon primus]
MSSLKGQLSNVEGSVKSMKAAVVVGSVLTVACLAAVFGVTILANEVSKEVKVSNGTLTAKNGQAVLTTNLIATTNINSVLPKAIELTHNNVDIVAKVNAVVSEGAKTTLICDDLVYTSENGQGSTQVTSGSVLESVLDNTVEKRNTQIPAWVVVVLMKMIIGAGCDGIAASEAFPDYSKTIQTIIQACSDHI